MAYISLDFLHNYSTGERRESDPEAYQYDEGHVLEAVVPVAVTSCEIQYWIRGMEKADAYTPTSITQNTDNTYTILGNIPNSYFEINGDLRVYIVVTDGDASITTYEGYIHIKERQMPEDYVDDDPDNEATRVLAEAQEAAQTATEKAGEAAASAEQAAESARTLTLDTTLTQSGQAADAKATGDAINDLKDDISQVIDSAYVTDTASGSIASFPDGADNVPVKSLTVDIEPVQSGSGDPSPTNVRPISGWTQAKVTRTGKNVLPLPEEKTENGITITHNGDGTITLTGTSTAIVYFDLDTDFDSSLFAGYEFSGFPSGYIGNSSSICFRISPANNRSGIQDITTGQYSEKTIADNGKHLRFAIRVVDGYAIPTGGLTFSPMLRKPTESSDFEPYTAQTVTIDLDGTRYGGSLDVGTGVLTVDRGYKVINGTENWSFSTAIPGERARAYITVSDIDTSTEDTNIVDLLSNQYPAISYSTGINIGGFGITGRKNIAQINVFQNQYLTVADWKEHLASENLTVAYPLAEPFEVQLTANEISTLLGQNNIWSDAGTVDVEYRADTKLYIEKLTAPTEDDMIADHAISANSFFMVGNTLYRATTAIASGATITVGTNATKLSLSDALNALA